jgi:arylsulfatase A-like enzyme
MTETVGLEAVYTMRVVRVLALASVLVSACGTFIAAAPANVPAAGSRTNVIVILGDDQGYADVGWQGTPGLVTPNMDRLAREGTRFDQFRLVACCCSPSRVSLLTGRYPDRTGIIRVLPPGSVAGLLPTEVTLGEVFAKGGYKVGLVGKWHIGDGPSMRPWNRGYETRACLLWGQIGSTYFDGEAFWGEGDRRKMTGYYTDVITAEAVGFLRTHRDDPFFLWVAHHAPHNPPSAPPERVERCKARLPQGLDPKLAQLRATHHAMLEVLDDGIGALLDTLDQTGLAARTIVVHLGDNGGLANTRAHVCYPFLGAKGLLTEGGVRVPFVVRWPGRVPASRASNAMLTALDLFPTLLAATGLEPPAGVLLDGQSALDAWTGTGLGPPPDRPIFATHGPGKQSLHYPEKLEKKALQRAVWCPPWKYVAVVRETGEQSESLLRLDERTSLRAPTGKVAFSDVVAAARTIVEADGRLDEPFFEVLEHKQDRPDMLAAMRSALNAWEKSMADGSPAPTAIAMPAPSTGR